MKILKDEYGHYRCNVSGQTTFIHGLVHGIYSLTFEDVVYKDYTDIFMILSSLLNIPASDFDHTNMESLMTQIYDNSLRWLKDNGLYGALVECVVQPGNEWADHYTLYTSIEFDIEVLSRSNAATVRGP